MPIYKYGCESCGYKFEELQKVNDEPLEKCPECGRQVRRMVTHSSFILKGTGWYATDYANKSANLNNDKKSSSDTAKKVVEKKEIKNKSEKAA
ncbi:MAG: FmdB family transcriptional regulator [bacterium]|nr:MAG: FmdB family transcriptional regulator [bacterium]